VFGRRWRRQNLSVAPHSGRKEQRPAAGASELLPD
jgi:hypothetical protein